MLKTLTHPCAALILVISLLIGCGPGENTSGTQNPSHSQSKPKVILLVIDSLRWDHLNANGYRLKTAPFLAELASRSVDFNLAISPSNYTGVSVPGILTGKPFSQLLDPHPEDVFIPESELTIAEAFRAAGYGTYLWSTNMHLKKSGFGQGFNKQFVQFSQTTGIISIEELIREIDASYTPPGVPEFHYVHTMDVHAPYRPPHPYDRAMESIGGNYPRQIVKDGALHDDHGDWLLSNLPEYSDTYELQDVDRYHLEDLYNGAIRYTDDFLPELLRSLDYDENRDLLIVTADHGEQFFEHGWWGHSMNLFTQEIHVPLIVRHPDFPAHKVDGAVSLMSLYPTLNEFYNLNASQEFQAPSLLSALNGEESVAGPAYAEALDRHGKAAALIQDDLLYIYYANQTARRPYSVWPYSAHLHDLATDYAGDNNLVSSDPERTGQMHSRLGSTVERWVPYQLEWATRPPEQRVTYSEGTMTFTLRNAGQPWGQSAAIPPQVEINEGTPQARIDIAGLQPGKRYALLFDYHLTSGWIEFAVNDDQSETPLWQHKPTRASNEFRKAQFAVVPNAESITLTATMTKPGKCLLQNIQFYAVETPAPEGLRTDAPAESAPAEGGLTAEEQDALEAIGYIE